jgi:hypothetical protein
MSGFDVGGGMAAGWNLESQMGPLVGPHELVSKQYLGEMR